MSLLYQFGRFEVLPATRQLLADGEPLVLGERAFSLLLCLIEQGDRVVTKDEVMKFVWPGLVVEENNLSVQVSALRKFLGAQALVTVRGRGYRFALDVSQGMSPVPALVRGDLALPDKPSIAVLPFSNLSGDLEQEYFSDGITEDVITELSRFHSLFVIARNSAFTYKGRLVDVRTVARELGVSYVLEGSIRRADNRVRVTAQLINAQTGNHIWAEKYDRLLKDVFAVQEEVTQAIVAAITPHVESSENERVRVVRPGNVSAYQLAMRGWSAAWVALSEADTVSRDQALKFAREALFSIRAVAPPCARLPSRSGSTSIQTVHHRSSRHYTRAQARPPARSQWTRKITSRIYGRECSPSWSASRRQV